MTTKDWLNRGWALDREITALESAKRRAYDRCVSGVASAVIAEVPDTTLRTLLTKRYLNFEKWEKIAVDLNYSWRQVMRLHGQALRAAEPLIANMA